MPRKPNPNRPLYASAIANAREKAGLTQAELGVAIGKDTSSIKKYEGGQIPPPFDVLYDICVFLSLDIYEVTDLDLRHGESSGLSSFLETPYNEILSLLDDSVSVLGMSDCGYTDDDIEIIFNGRTGHTTKSSLVLQVAAARKKLRDEYMQKLADETNRIVKSTVKL